MNRMRRIFVWLCITALLIYALPVTVLAVDAADTVPAAEQTNGGNIVSVTAFRDSEEIALESVQGEQGPVFYVTVGTTLQFDKPADETQKFVYSYLYKDSETEEIFLPQSQNTGFTFKAVKQGNFFLKVSRHSDTVQEDVIFAIIVTDGESSYSDHALNVTDSVEISTGSSKVISLSGSSYQFMGVTDTELLEMQQISSNLVSVYAKNAGTARICLIGRDGIARTVTFRIKEGIARTPNNDIVQLNSAAFTAAPVEEASTLQRRFTANTGKQIVFSKVCSTTYTYRYYYQNEYGQDICIQPESTNGTFKFTPMKPKKYVIIAVVTDRARNISKKEVFTIMATGKTIEESKRIDTIMRTQSKSVTFSDNVKSIWRSNANVSYSFQKKNVTFSGVREGTSQLMVVTEKGYIYENYIKVAKKLTEPFVLKSYAVSMDVQKTFQITFTQKGDDTNFSYKSSNTSVATVNKNGLITAVKAGQADITVSNKIQSQVIRVTVNTSSIKLNTSSLSLFVKNKAVLKAILDEGSYTAVTFTSSNPAVASVESNGTVTANQSGTAVITARTANNKTASCTVTVTTQVPENVTIKFASVCPTVHVGKTVTLDIKISDTRYANYVSVGVSDRTKAAVSYSNGRCTIKGLKMGKVRLTASLPNGKQISTFFYSVGDYAQYRTKYAVEKGVDLSCFNENVNYQKLKEEGFTFVILRSGFGDELSQKDTMFEKHIQGAKRAGLGIGIYHFSYAVNASDARREAQVCNQIISRYRGDIQYGVFYDYEDDSVRYATQRGYAVNRKVVTDIITAFCEEIERCGFVAGVYMNTAYGKEYLDMNRVKPYMFWYAAPGATTYAFDFDIWQYSFWLRSPAFSGEVDGDKIYSTVFRELK